jgi:hypothetical protein
VEVVDAAWKEIPRHWLGDDEDALERMLETLLKRRARVSALLLELQQKRATAFANWH